HALAQRVILVTDESGQHVKGNITLENQERRWTFAPDSAWPRGRYNLVIQATLEDLAGNNIGKPFDVDLRKGDQQQSAKMAAATPFKLSFEVR
ncbi:MAG: Ig-like domain-containing protein, partial [Acidobacteriota bacterium]|nr:Ig-like domain-containing protein [Acidobacteriota bacterium]